MQGEDWCSGVFGSTLAAGASDHVMRTMCPLRRLLFRSLLPRKTHVAAPNVLFKHPALHRRRWVPWTWWRNSLLRVLRLRLFAFGGGGVEGLYECLFLVD